MSLIAGGTRLWSSIRKIVSPPMVAPEIKARPARFTTVGGWLQAEVPVFIPCFNNRTYCDLMLRQLEGRGFRRIVFVDNASTASDMRAWLGGLGDRASVIWLEANTGPWHTIRDPHALAMMPRYFCLTDPDLSFHPELPEDFLAQLARVIDREKVGKAGLALDIHDRAAMRDDQFRYGDQTMRIWEWEQKFWTRPLDPMPGGDPVYAAPIDTTFALYDRERYDPEDFYKAVRVAGRFTARHLPWYRETVLPADEVAEYLRTEKFSNYHRVEE